MMKIIFSSFSQGPCYIHPRDRVLPYVFVTRCREKRRKNGIDLAHMVQDHHRQDNLEDLRQSSSSRHTTNVSYPNISQETARRARLWAVRILFLLPRLLAYRTSKVKGLRNYYLHGQQIYPKDVTSTIKLCMSLNRLLT